MKNNSFISFVAVSIFLVFTLTALPAYAQNMQDFVKYNKQSNFIREFQIPIKETGLKGITVDTQGNAWFYHSTNSTSTIVKLETDSGKFTQFDIKAETTVQNPIINLAGGMLVFDKERNTVWFTDSRTNSVGKLDVQGGQVGLIKIPTAEAGPMGLVLSPDSKSIWFAEIESNKIAQLDMASEKITEYSTREQTGPTFLAFDSAGNLWVTLSYSHNVLRVDKTTLNTDKPEFSTVTLPKSYTFSPFGITIVSVNGVDRIFVSDHGSSRVISSDVSSNLNSYVSYWTSPATNYPVTLPGQLVTDKVGNIYFPEHGGNRIAKINAESGMMTEYEIPTGPLSTTLFIAISDDGKKVWFAEVAANKIAYLDTTIPVPFSVGSGTGQITLDKSGSKTVDILVNAENNSKSVSLGKVDMNVTGMTDSGLRGVSYLIQPQKIDMSKTSLFESKVILNAEHDARPGQYTIMVTASAFEKDNLVVSQLYPVQITLNLPEQASKSVGITKTDESGYLTDLSFPNIIRFTLIFVVIILIAYLVYRRIKRKVK
ncbi:MAG: SMP-30/gluconolactonase/LRE family protein [Thaumarchaeota archaeon]|nr:SMP-30/gluconolactonase/LRE family protein [Nitrososphaerota archaeon]MBI3642020.1 SMP-30/gluconolactonase/LRE family protein [Nitrososphaerota archaeon]